MVTCRWADGSVQQWLYEIKQSFYSFLARRGDQLLPDHYCHVVSSGIVFFLTLFSQIHPSREHCRNNIDTSRAQCLDTLRWKQQHSNNRLQRRRRRPKSGLLTVGWNVASYRVSNSEGWWSQLQHWHNSKNPIQCDFLTCVDRKYCRYSWKLEKPTRVNPPICVVR